MRLSEIAGWWDRIEAALEERGGEPTPEIEAELLAVLGAEREKVDGYALVIKALEQEAEGLKALEAEFRAKREARERRRQWLCDRVRQYLEFRGEKELRGDIYRFTLQRNGGKRPLEVLVPATSLPDSLQKVTVEADTEAIRRLAEAAGAVDLVVNNMVIARLAEPGVHLRIR